MLPYMIGALFGVGYGSVVAAGGWEALRVPVNASGAVGAGSSAAGGGGGGGGGGIDGQGDAAGNAGAAGDLHGGTSDISFVAQVCARDTRAEQEAHAHINDDDDDEDFESSGAGSDNDDDIQLEERQNGGGAGAGVDPRSTTAAAVTDQSSARTAPVTRSQLGNARSTSDSAVGGSGTGIGSDTVRFESPEEEEKRAIPDALQILLPGRDGRGSCVTPAGGLSLVHQAASYDSTEGEDDEDEEEDRGGWGQVVVKPVKVARWDKQGQRSKAQLSLNQLRALILERAESTPQKATYRRAARMVRG